MKHLLVAASALALMTGTAYANDPDMEKDSALENAAEETGAAIERGIEATGEALDDAGDYIARKADQASNGLREVEEGEVTYTTATRSTYSGNDIIGTPIYGDDGRVVARVDDIWISDKGEVEALLVDRGGFLGLGEEEVAVETGTVTFASDASGNVFGSTKLSDEQLEKIADTRYDASVEYRTDPASYEGLTVDNDIIGRSVVNSKGDAVASVRDVLLSRDGEITHLVLAQGGLLGFGGDLVALPYEGLTYEQGDTDGALVIDTTTKELSNMPEFRYDMDVDAKAKMDHDMDADAKMDMEAGAK